jgi:nucleoside 2-deoxyribosyltransferase
MDDTSGYLVNGYLVNVDASSDTSSVDSSTAVEAGFSVAVEDESTSNSNSYYD